MAGIDIPKLAERAADIGFKKTAKIAKTATLKLKPETGTFDPASGELGAGSQADIEIDCRFFHDKQAKGSDQQYKSATALIKVKDVIAKGFSERISLTTVAVIDSISWDVFDVQIDPGGALYILKLRRG